MDDYIDREAAISAAIDGADTWDGGYSATRDTAISEELKKVPAADVRPVVRGKWIGDYDGYADGYPVYDMWSCSECGWDCDGEDEEPTWNFCPNCGADMRGDEE